MCSLIEHIEREIRERERQTVEKTESTKNESTRTQQGPFLLPGSDRRWTYQGTETHYGYTYHLWQNAATKRKYAWEVETYRKAATKETA